MAMLEPEPEQPKVELGGHRGGHSLVSTWSELEHTRGERRTRSKEQRSSGLPCRRPNFMESGAWEKVVGELWHLTIDVDSAPQSHVSSKAGTPDSISYAQYEALYLLQPRTLR